MTKIILQYKKDLLDNLLQSLQIYNDVSLLIKFYQMHNLLCAQN